MVVGIIESFFIVQNFVGRRALFINWHINIIIYNKFMKYTVREYRENIHITACWWLLSASLSEWTSSRVRTVIGRDLVEGERFYWLNKIYNRSGKKWAWTQLLRFVIDTFSQKQATLWLIPSPDLPGWEEVSSHVSLEERLAWWYKRHWFRETSSKYPVLIYESRFKNY